MLSLYQESPISIEEIGGWEESWGLRTLIRWEVGKVRRDLIEIGETSSIARFSKIPCIEPTPLSLSKSSLTRVEREKYHKKQSKREEYSAGGWLELSALVFGLRSLVVVVCNSVQVKKWIGLGRNDGDRWKELWGQRFPTTSSTSAHLFTSTKTPFDLDKAEVLCQLYRPTNPKFPGR
jgi:hypothetical protein